MKSPLTTVSLGRPRRRSRNWSFRKPFLRKWSTAHRMLIAVILLNPLILAQYFAHIMPQFRPKRPRVQPMNIVAKSTPGSQNFRYRICAVWHFFRNFKKNIPYQRTQFSPCLAWWIVVQIKPKDHLHKFRGSFCPSWYLFRKISNFLEYNLLRKSNKRTNQGKGGKPNPWLVPADTSMGGKWWMVLGI